MAAPASPSIWLSFTQKWPGKLLKRWKLRLREVRWLVSSAYTVFNETMPGQRKFWKITGKMYIFTDTWWPLSYIAPFSPKSLHLLGRKSGIRADRPYRELPGACLDWLKVDSCRHVSVSSHSIRNTRPDRDHSCAGGKTYSCKRSYSGRSSSMGNSKSTTTARQIYVAAAFQYPLWWTSQELAVHVAELSTSWNSSLLFYLTHFHGNYTSTHSFTSRLCTIL